MKSNFNPQIGELDNLKKKNFILHIGLAKTGSTFIQKNFCSIEDSNYKYLTPAELHKTMGLEDYLLEPDEVKKKRIIKFIKTIEEKNIIISDEGLFGTHSNGYKDVHKRFQLLENLFKKVRYIIFFREPSSIIYSGFFQGLKKNKLDLKFENYINTDINILYKTIPKKSDHNTNYKVYNYNKIFNDYLEIQERVLFVEFEKFFKDKSAKKLSEFLGINIKLNFSDKINKSYKELVYLQFYNKFLLFKLVKLLLISFLKLFNKIKSGKDVVINVVKLINFSNKIIPKKYYEKSNKKVEKLVEEIKSYFSKNFNDFKKKLHSAHHICCK